MIIDYTLRTTARRTLSSIFCPPPTAIRLHNSNPLLLQLIVTLFLILNLILTSVLPPSPLRNASSVRAPSASSGTSTACRSPRAKQADMQMTDSMRAIGNTCRYREAREESDKVCRAWLVRSGVNRGALGWTGGAGQKRAVSGTYVRMRWVIKCEAPGARGTGHKTTY